MPGAARRRNCDSVRPAGTSGRRAASRGRAGRPGYSPGPRAERPNPPSPRVYWDGLDSQTQLYVTLSGAIPALIAMVIVDRLDAKRPEPWRLRWGVTAIGMLSCVPAIAIEVALTKYFNGRGMPAITYDGAAANSFVVAAAVEEACKIGAVYWIVWRRPEFDERMDGIVYAARAGLGFALLENMLYLLGQHDLGGAAVTWIMRAVLAIPGHAMWTGAMGYLAARRRFDRRGPGILGGYLLAVAGHGLYDYSVFVAAPLGVEGYGTQAKALLAVPPLVIIAFWLLMRKFARTALALDDADAARAAAAPPAAVPPPAAT
jgi:protease PrsW